MKKRIVLFTLVLIQLLMLSACFNLSETDDDGNGNGNGEVQINLPSSYSLSQPSIPNATALASAKQAIDYFNNAITSAINKMSLFNTVTPVVSSVVYTWSKTLDNVDLNLTAQEVSANMYEWTLQADGTGDPFSTGSQTYNDVVIIRASLDAQDNSMGIISELATDGSPLLVTSWFTSPTNNRIAAFSADGGTFSFAEGEATWNIGSEVSAYFYNILPDTDGMIYYGPTLSTDRFSIQWTDGGAHGTLETHGNTSPNYAEQW
ncbi:hypothetical protein ACFLZV_05225 [Candidatus Margulisiibacteriota bacterium]